MPGTSPYCLTKQGLAAMALVMAYRYCQGGIAKATRILLPPLVPHQFSGLFLILLHISFEFAISIHNRVVSARATNPQKLMVRTGVY
jgi:hypothetical protein